MAADLQYRVSYEDIGPIFVEFSHLVDTKVKLIRETAESRYSLILDLDDLFSDLLSERDWDVLGSLKHNIQSAKEVGDMEAVAEYSADLTSGYTEIEIENYDANNGNYYEYISKLANTVLDALAEYESDLNDKPVFVETWL